MKLQILKDMSKPLVDKETGEIKEDNVYETFDVTIVGATYPLPIKKEVSLLLRIFCRNIVTTLITILFFVLVRLKK